MIILLRNVASAALEFFNTNKEWILSGIGVFFVGLLTTIIIRRKDKRERRIERFVDEFRRLYIKNDGVKLEILIPAGINNMKNDKEIKLAFEALMKVIPGHPLRRNWKPRVEKVGYKTFLGHVTKSGKILDNKSIETFLSELEK